MSRQVCGDCFECRGEAARPTLAAAPATATVDPAHPPSLSLSFTLSLITRLTVT